MAWPVLMPPWDQATYFQPALETTFTGITGPTPICLADPQRIALILSACADYAVLISTNAGATQGQGFTIMPDDNPFMLLHGDVGPLVQLQWFAVGPGEGANLTVIEIRLAKWPSLSQGVLSGEIG